MQNLLQDQVLWPAAKDNWQKSSLGQNYLTLYVQKKILTKR